MASTPLSEFRLGRRVQFYETDAAGIVHFSWYPRYMEEAEHAIDRRIHLAARQAAGSHQQVVAHGQFAQHLMAFRHGGDTAAADLIGIQTDQVLTVEPDLAECRLDHAGNAEHGKTIRLNPFSLISGKRIAGSWGGESRPDSDIPRYAALFSAGRLPLSQLITAEYRLADINQAFDDLEGGRVARALVAI